MRRGTIRRRRRLCRRGTIRRRRRLCRRGTIGRGRRLCRRATRRSRPDGPHRTRSAVELADRRGVASRRFRACARGHPGQLPRRERGGLDVRTPGRVPAERPRWRVRLRGPPRPSVVVVVVVVVSRKYPVPRHELIFGEPPARPAARDVVGAQLQRLLGGGAHKGRRRGRRVVAGRSAPARSRRGHRGSLDLVPRVPDRGTRLAIPVTHRGPRVAVRADVHRRRRRRRRRRTRLILVAGKDPSQPPRARRRRRRRRLLWGIGSPDPADHLLESSLLLQQRLPPALLERGHGYSIGRGRRRVRVRARRRESVGEAPPASARAGNLRGVLVLVRGPSRGAGAGRRAVRVVSSRPSRIE